MLECTDVRVTHITEDMALRTTNALLQTQPAEVLKNRQLIPGHISAWIDVMEQEFKGYRYREDLGRIMKSV